MNETDLAFQIASGAVPSPQPVAGFWLVALRISGSGLARREQHNELVYRDSQLITSPEFLQRCNGLPVVANHPDGTLTGDEYASRSLGAIVLPYTANGDGVMSPEGTEAWGVARIYGDEIVQAMSQGMSTSPAVVFTPADGNTSAELADGSTLLIENKPSLLCSLAICDQGVWDKSGPPAGCRFDSSTSKTGEKTMTEEEQVAADKARKDAETSNIDRVLSGLTTLTEKMDAIGTRLDSLEKKRDSTEKTEKEEREDAARKDSTLTHQQRAERDTQLQTERSDAQARAERAYQAFGMRADAPMQSEQPLAYRVRLARGLMRHSPMFKEADLGLLSADPKTFCKVEEKIYADAVAASRLPPPDGRQEKRVRQTETGHIVTEFHGGDTIFKRLSQPSMRVRSIHVSRADQAR